MKSASRRTWLFEKPYNREPGRILGQLPWLALFYLVFGTFNGREHRLSRPPRQPGATRTSTVHPGGTYYADVQARSPPARSDPRLRQGDHGVQQRIYGNNSLISRDERIAVRLRPAAARHWASGALLDLRRLRLHGDRLVTTAMPFDGIPRCTRWALRAELLPGQPRGLPGYRQRGGHEHWHAYDKQQGRRRDAYKLGLQIQIITYEYADSPCAAIVAPRRRLQRLHGQWLTEGLPGRTRTPRTGRGAPSR